MTLFIAFASLRDEDDLPSDPSCILPSWLALFRGVRTVLESNNGSIYRSPISFLFSSHEVNRIWQSKQLNLEPLIEFQNFINASVSEDEQTRQLLLGVFHEIRRALYFYIGEEYDDESKIRSLFTWMYRLPDEFLTLLRNNNSKALCVLAFFCVLLHRLEYMWWAQGWGTHLIDRIYTVLDEVHRFWIKWPIQQIGWIPKPETSQILQYSTPSKT
jgi:hypothetical protein